VINIDIKRANLEIKLNIKSGELLAITGASGSGKTTLLRTLAGLEKANGTIEVDGCYWLKNNRSQAPQKRSIGFVMQDYALFENMSVEQNLLYVNRDIELANRLLKEVGLFDLKSRYPKELSGGQQQRVALVRALMLKPKLLLLDEPLSALDKGLRYSLQELILKLHKEFNLTTILVSHDPQEVQRLANRVIYLKDGEREDIDEHMFTQARIVDKIEDINKYELIVEYNFDIKRVSVKESIFRKYNIGDSVELELKIKEQE